MHGRKWFLGFLISFVVAGMLGLGTAGAEETKNEVKEKGLIAYWNFDDGKGDIAKDLSGNGNDGKVYGAEWVDGAKGKALQFSGEDAYVDCGNSATLKPAKCVSLEFWIKILSYSNESVTQEIGFPIQQGYTFWQWSNEGKPQRFVFEMNTIGETAGENRRKYDLELYFIPLDQWVQITAVFDGENGKITVYKNGNLFESVRNVTKGDIVYGAKANFCIGKNYNCIIDEVKVYNISLEK